MRPLLLHCLKALYPSVDGLPGIAETEPEPFVRKLLAEVPWLMWFGLLGGVAVFVLTPLITVYRPVPSFLLSAETLDAHAERVSDHPVYLIRNAVMLLKMAAGLHWAAAPNVRQAFALPPYPQDPDTWRTQ